MAERAPPPAPLLHKGEVYRGDSYISEDLVLRRLGWLYADGFITRREEGSDHTKVWPLNASCKLTPSSGVTERRVRVLKSGPTVLSLAYRNFDRETMFGFRVSWPSTGVLSKDSLLLTFMTEDEAATWYTAFKGAIHRLRQESLGRSRNSVKKDLKTRDVSGSLGNDSFGTPGQAALSSSGTLEDWSAVDSPTNGEHGSRAPRLGEQLAGDLVRATASEVSSASTHNAAGDTQMAQDGRRLSTASMPDFQNEGRSAVHASIVARQKTWAPFRVLNGLAVYKEEEDEHGVGGAYMVSSTICCEPHVCWRALMNIDVGTQCIWAFSSISDFVEVDKYEHEFRATMAPQGSQGSFGVAPREVLVRRSWRQDEDGTYNVFFQSKDGPFRPSKGHVAARIHAMGFTMAPLRVPKKGNATCHSPECLVTVVLKVDLGGCFANGSWLGRLPWNDHWQREWVETLLMTVVSLRDKVEQDRFVIRPNQIRGQGITQVAPSRSRMSMSRASLASSFRPTFTAQHRDVKHAIEKLEAPKELSQSDEVMSDASSDEAKTAASEEVDTWLDRKFWECPGTAGFKVRGPNYLKDKKKLASLEPMFRLQGLELVKMKETVYHVSRYLPIVRRSTAPFNFVLCFTLPWGGNILALVMVFEADTGPLPHSEPCADDQDALCPFDLNLARFLAGSNALRDSKLKLIPSLAEGSWIVRQAVGQTPVMLGKRLKTVYFEEDGYFEADIDISANSTAASITSMVAGAIKSLVFDIGIVLEGHTDEELPERLLGSARLNRLDLSAAITLDTSAEIPQVPRRKSLLSRQTSAEQ